MPMHMVAVVVVEPGSTGLRVADVRQMVAGRLHAVPRLRRRAVPTPFGVDHAVWVDDPDLDLDHHVRAAALPRPGGPAELAAYLGDLAGCPLDPARPLWQLIVLEGLESGHVALVVKVHHALFDGVAGFAVLAGLFDLDPTGPAAAGDPRSTGDRPSGGRAPSAVPGRTSLPGVADLLALSARRWICRPWSAADAVAGTYLAMRTMAHEHPQASPAPGTSEAGEPATTGRGAGGPAGDGRGAEASRGHEEARRGGSTPPARSWSGGPRPFGGPRAPWNGTIAAQRSMAMVDVPLEDLRMVARVVGATVNDVLLAGVGGALRRRLVLAGAAPGPGSRPLLAMVPVSARRPCSPGDRPAAEEGLPATSAGVAGNELSAMVVSLATDVTDPLSRLRAVAASSERAKTQLTSIPGGVVAAWAELAVPAVATRLARLAGNLQLFDRLPPLANVVVSDVVGPEVPLWCAGRRVLAIYPFGPVADGIGLNITAVSYGPSLGIGLSSCRRLLPDLAELATDLGDSLGELTRRAAATRHSSS